MTDDTYEQDLAELEDLADQLFEAVSSHQDPGPLQTLLQRLTVPSEVLQARDAVQADFAKWKKEREES
jgi:hypothetical protein